LRDKHLKWYLVLPALLFLLGVCIYPLAVSLRLSFYQWNLAKPSVLRRFIGLANYANIFRDELWFSALKNTLLFVVVSVGIEFLLGLAFALLVSGEIKGKRAIRSMVLIPTMIAPVVVGLIWKMFLNSQYGILNYSLTLFGVRPHIDLLGSVTLALPSIILVDIWEWSPFIAVVLLAGILAIPHYQYEAAIVDGASVWHKFVFITLPFLTPCILVVLLIRVMDTFKIFDLVYVLTQGGPGSATEVMSSYIYRQGFKTLNMGYAAAMSYILLIIIIIVSSSLVGIFEKGKT